MAKPRARLAGARNTAMIAACAAVIAIGGLSAAPASAAPRAASGCNFVVCMNVTTPTSKGSFTIRAWDRYGKDCFYGHYQVGRAGTSFYVNSPTRNWCHLNNYTHTFNLSKGKGNWCVIGWKKLKDGKYADVGQPCESVT
jgi:hypothetical protein